MDQDTDGCRQVAKKTICWKCGLVCKNKQELSVHQNKCLSNAVKGSSFFQNERIEANFLPVRIQDLNDEKILPATQPLDTLSPDDNRAPVETLFPRNTEVSLEPVNIDDIINHDNKHTRSEGVENTHYTENIHVQREAVQLLNL